MPYKELSESNIHQMINDGKVKRSLVQEKSWECRKSHLEDLAMQYANQHNMTSQNTILELISHKESRGTFRSFRNHLKPKMFCSLSTVWKLKDENGNYIKNHDNKEIYTGKDEINRELL